LPRTYVFTIVFSMIIGAVLYKIYITSNIILWELIAIAVLGLLIGLNEKKALLENMLSRTARKTLRYIFVFMVCIIGVWIYWHLL